MKKTYLFGAAAVLVASSMSAAPITPDEALSRLGGSRFKAAGAPLKLVHTSQTETGEPSVYVFNRGVSSGYVVASADDMAYPVLGYSDNGSFDAGNIAPALAWWLGEYTRQIEYARNNHLPASASASPKAASDREAVAPMLKTHWDQGAPYNNQCPIYQTQRTYTGCVATAMAQVMNYWKYPEKGSGSVSYDASSIQKRLTLDFTKQSFDWENMADTYLPGQYTSEQANAVSYLMKACGYAVKMDYGIDSSGALAMLIRNGLVKYFQYDGNARYELRMYYSSDDWEKMIYDNIKNVGPVLYGGDSMLGGGHSFVCDGYDGQGYFHFNWGWAGMSNGYYSLNALNPQALGTGGGTGGGYNFTQDAVLGIQPPTGEPVKVVNPTLTAMGSLSGEIIDGVLKFSLADHALGYWVNYNASTLNVVMGARFESVENASAEPIIVPVSDMIRGVSAADGVTKAAITGCNLAESGLVDGTYKVSLMVLNHDYSKTEGEYIPVEAGWQPVQALYAFPDYVQVSKTGDNFNVANYATPRLKMTSGSVVGPLYFGCTSKFKFTVKNPYDFELTSGFAPTLYSPAAQTFAFIGESVLLTIPAKGEVTQELTTDLTAMSQSFTQIAEDTEFYLTFLDEDTYAVYSNDILVPVTMKANPGKPSVSLSSEIDVANAVKRTTAKEDIFTVSNPSEIEVSAGVKLDKGYFSYPVMAALCTMGAGGAANIITYSGKTVILDNAGDVCDFNATVAYPDADENTTYYILMTYGAGNQLYPIYGKKTAMLLFDPSLAGVSDVDMEDEDIMVVYDKSGGLVTAVSSNGIESIDAYTMDGNHVASATSTSTLILDGFDSGVVIVRVKDVAGNSRTVKIVR